MKLPVIQGIIDRRLLVNYRVDPDVVRPMLLEPPHLRLHEGHAIAGVCLIRLTKVRPTWTPMWLGAFDILRRPGTVPVRIGVLRLCGPYGRPGAQVANRGDARKRCLTATQIFLALSFCHDRTNENNRPKGSSK